RRRRHPARRRGARRQRDLTGRNPGLDGGAGRRYALRFLSCHLEPRPSGGRAMRLRLFPCSVLAVLLTGAACGAGRAAGGAPPAPQAEAKGEGARAPAGESKDAATGEAKTSEPDTFGMKFRWDDGLVGGTADKAFRFHVGGRIDFDSGWYNAPANL